MRVGVCVRVPVHVCIFGYGCGCGYGCVHVCEGGWKARCAICGAQCVSVCESVRMHVLVRAYVYWEGGAMYRGRPFKDGGCPLYYLPRTSSLNKLPINLHLLSWVSCDRILCSFHYNEEFAQCMEVLAVYW